MNAILSSVVPMKTRFLIFASLLAVLLPLQLSAAPGDLYVTDDTAIHKYAPDGTHTLFAALPARPRGLVFDRTRFLFVSTLDTTFHDNVGRILHFSPDGSFTVFLSGIHNPEGIALHNESGVLFDTESDLTGDGSFNSSQIGKITPAGGELRPARISDTVTFTHLFFDIAFDNEHNLFLADAFANSIFMVTPSGKFATFATVNGPDGLAFDTNGNLYVSDQGGGSIIKITPEGDQSIFATGLGGPRGLAFDSAGNLFAAGHDNNTVYKITPSGAVTVFATGLDVPQFLAFEP